MSSPKKIDRYEQFVALFTRHERAVRSVVRSTLPASQDADDVMQEIGLACWRKFTDFQSHELEDAFFRWACVVARFEVLKYRRKCARDRLVLSEETILLLTTDAEARSNLSDSESQLLERCLNELKDADRRLVLSVHTRGQSVAEIARQLGQSARRLYSRVNVLRDILGECMQNKSAGVRT